MKGAMKGVVININEPNESKARGEELFPGEVDELKELVNDWLKHQPEKRREKGKVIKLFKNKE